MEQMNDALCEFSEVFFISKTDFGFCSLLTFETSVPEDSAPVTSRSHRLNPVLAHEVDATLNQHLAAGLIQLSTPPYSSPLVVIPKTSAGVKITVNYKKISQISKLIQLPIPRVDQVLYSLGSRRVFFSPVRPGFLAPPNSGAQRYGSSCSILHTQGPLSPCLRAVWVVI